MIFIKLVAWESVCRFPDYCDFHKDCMEFLRPALAVETPGKKSREPKGAVCANFVFIRSSITAIPNSTVQRR